MKLHHILLAATLGMTAAVAAAQAPAPKAAAAKSALPEVDAEVRKLDAAKGTIVLRHQDIPNLGMSGMTMQFDVANRKLLEGVKPGDHVKFQVDMVGGSATVLGLRVVK